jgi:hypothetical protein
LNINKTDPPDVAKVAVAAGALGSRQLCGVGLGLLETSAGLFHIARDIPREMV